MTITAPGISTKTHRKNGSTRDARRMMALVTASDLAGGQTVLAEAMGINPRHLRQKMAAERPADDNDMRTAIAALRARAKRITEHADKMADLIAD